MTRLPLMIDLSAAALTPEERELLAERRVAGVCLFGRNVTDRHQLADYVAEARALAGDELVVGIDQEGGGVLRLLDVPFPPAAMALGAADDPVLTEEVAAATGRALAAVGVNLDFAPVADVNSNPANPVIADRSFGADPARVARHVAAFVRGLQSAGVGATLKHFPGHGDTSLDSHLDLPVVDRSLDELRAAELVPFRAGMAAGAAAVMSAHIVLPRLEPGVPATLSRRAMHGLLREELGFEGLSVTDALDMKAVADRFSPGEAVVRALLAGVDVPLTLGSVAKHRSVLAAIDEALAAGGFGPDGLAGPLARLAAFARAYPARAEGGRLDAAVEAADRATMARATRAGLVTLAGPLPELAPGDRVAVLANRTVRASAASQVSARPAEGLVEELQRRGVQVAWLELPWGEAVDPTPFLGGLSPLPRAVLYASTSRTRVAEGEAVTARNAAEWARHAGREFVHVALWNPYSAELVPGPALLAFGYRGTVAAAVVEALMGGGASARAPVPLRALAK